MAPWHHACHPEEMQLLRSGLFSEKLEALEQGVRTVAPEPAVWVPDWVATDSLGLSFLCKP